MRWALSSPGPIGLDVGVRSIKAAQMRRSRNGWHIVALAVIPRRSPGADIDGPEVERMRSVLIRQGFVGDDVVLAAPNGKILSGILELPPRGSGAPVAQIARMELSRMHGINPASFEMSYWHLPAAAGSKESTQVMAVGCAHDAANEYLDIFENAGLNVKALELHASAALRGCETALSPQPGITAILDIGWSSAFLSIVCRGVVAYDRDLREAGVGELSKTVIGKYRLEAEEAERLLAEIGLASDSRIDQPDRQTFEGVHNVIEKHFAEVAEEMLAPFSYASHQYPDTGVKRLLLIGGGANIPGLAGYLADVLQIEVKAVTPADLAECPPAILAKSNDAALVQAVGLAEFGG